MSSNVDKRGYRQLMARLREAERGRVRVGVLQSAGGGATVEGAGAPITMAELAAIHELGAPEVGIPQRSFLRDSLIKNLDELSRVSGKLGRAVVLGKQPIKIALGLLGEWGVAVARKYITAGAHIPPPLKPATVKRKGSTRPLVDTGRLVQSIAWEIQ